MPWRDIAGLALVVLGALVLLAGIVYAFVVTPLAAALITVGCAAVIVGALVGRYDPDKAHASDDEPVRSVDQPQPEQAA